MEHEDDFTKMPVSITGSSGSNNCISSMGWTTMGVMRVVVSFVLALSVTVTIGPKIRSKFRPNEFSQPAALSDDSQPAFDRLAKKKMLIKKCYKRKIIYI